MTLGLRLRVEGSLGDQGGCTTMSRTGEQNKPQQKQHEFNQLCPSMSGTMREISVRRLSVCAVTKHEQRNYLPPQNKKQHHANASNMKSNYVTHRHAPDSNTKQNNNNTSDNYVLHHAANKHASAVGVHCKRVSYTTTSHRRIENHATQTFPT